MTSGQFHSIEIGTITINREERQRRGLDPKYISELADSIRRLGLINPIVITRENVLVAGECRVSACNLLGWTHIAGQYVDEIDQAQLCAIELEENVKRQALPWEDECKAVLEYHAIRQSEDPAWNTEATGTALGLSESSVAVKMQVARELIAQNPKVLAAGKLSTARGIVARANERRDEESLHQLREIAKVKTPNHAPEPEQIICADFIEWSKTYSGPKFNFIHCDFPYGIGADKQQQGGSVATHGEYSDTEKDYWDLCSAIGAFLDIHCTESVHVMFWFSMHFYHSTRAFFSRNVALDFDPFPLLWVKSDNIGLLPDSQRGPRRIYETAFFGSRGDRKIVSSVSNAIFAPTDRSIHMSVKPEPVLRKFFSMFVDNTTIMLDPTCGSGSSVRAAKSAGANHAIGIEKNELFANDARRKFKE